MGFEFVKWYVEGLVISVFCNFSGGSVKENVYRGKSNE